MKRVTMLRIYVADGCPGSPIARRLAEWLQAQAPAVPLEVVNIDDTSASVPRHVFGTPTYTWNDRTLYLGNPSRDELLERVRSLYAAHGGPHP